MQNALLVGLSRQMALSRELDVVANNIANIDTTGYKADNAAFTEYLMPGAKDGEFRGKDQRVSFVEDRATWIDLSPGALERTGNPLDVAIDGKGYIAVQTPRGVRYTRAGSLAINASGQLVTQSGDQVLGTSGPITFQQTDHDVSISPSGLISVREGTGGTSANRGTLQVVTFDQQRRLQKDGDFDLPRPGRRQSQPGAGLDAGGAGLAREIQRSPRRRDGAHDRDHAQLFRHRRDPAAAGRSAQKLAAAIGASAELELKPEEIIPCVRSTLQRPEWRPWTSTSRSSPATSPT